MVVGRGLMCFGDFVGLGLWVWVHGFGFMGLGSWVYVHGSLTWPAWIVKLIGLISVGHRLDRCGSLIFVVIIGIVVASGRRWVWLLGWDSETERERQWDREGEWERERESEIREREDEKNKNKKGIKNYEEIIFKWSYKKRRRSFDVWYIVKWVLKF